MVQLQQEDLNFNQTQKTTISQPPEEGLGKWPKCQNNNNKNANMGINLCWPNSTRRLQLQQKTKKDFNFQREHASCSISTRRLQFQPIEKKRTQRKGKETRDPLRMSLNKKKEK